MPRHQVPATVFAVLPLAEGGFLKRHDVLSPGLDLYRIRFPETESVDRASRPGAAGGAMTITHRLRRTGDFKLNGAAKAASSVTHDIRLSFLMTKSGNYLGSAARV
jgi:hypothetical protein